MSVFGPGDEPGAIDLASVRGLRIVVPDDLRRRLNATLPEEVAPKESLKLTPDKSFAMREMARSLQNGLSDKAWPETQYLWPLHPVMDWIHDQAELLYGRNEAPLAALTGGLAPSELLYVIAGTIPNRQAAPVIDQWFGLLFEDGRFRRELDMEAVVERAGLDRDDRANTASAGDDAVRRAADLLPVAIGEARRVLTRHYDRYVEGIAPKIESERAKLEALRGRHKESLGKIGPGRGVAESAVRVREIDALFDNFRAFVSDTLTVDNNPHIRVIAVLTGAVA
jgi:hypothetical protein